MAVAGRNEPCPCGSGRKYKKCCGIDRDAERALEDRLAAVEELARLAYRSPRLLPECDAYDDWVRGVVVDRVAPDVQEAIATLDADDAVRIVAACLELYPDEWSLLAERCGNDRDAGSALLGGAVAAGIRDFRFPERFAVETVEESDRLARDPFEALAMCLEGRQLWGPDEGDAAEHVTDAIPDWVDDDEHARRWHAALAALAPTLTTPWHERRLARLVVRVEKQLPFDGFPRASAAIRAGCEEFASDEAFRRRLAATLLGDMVGNALLRELRASLVA